VPHLRLIINERLKNMAKEHYNEQGRAGIKLLITAMRKEVERVENRYRNKQTREVCQAVASLCDGMWEALTEDRPFTVYLGKQLALNFVFGEDGEGDVPFSDPFEYELSPEEIREIWEEYRDENKPNYEENDDYYSRVD